MAATTQVGVAKVPVRLAKAAKRQAKVERTKISLLWMKAMEWYLERCADERRQQSEAEKACG